MEKQFLIQVALKPGVRMLSTDAELRTSLELVLTQFFKIWATETEHPPKVNVTNISDLDLVLSPRS